MKIFLTFPLFILLSGLLNAQQINPPCGMDIVQQSLATENAAYAIGLENYQKQLHQLSSSAMPRTGAVLSLPVVVHIIHSGEFEGIGSNISTNRIFSQLDVLNQDYRRLNADAANTPVAFADLGADTAIEFCLASTDPSGNPSTGITRHVYNNIPSISYIEQTIKPATTWDPDHYINIWTVDMPSISSNVLGYAYLPTMQMVGSNRDGLVINYKNFGIIGNISLGRTTTHEMGHYLGLIHIWGDSNSSGNPIGCSSDDGIADTPNAAAPYYDCPTFGQSSCGSIDMHMNFMDYVEDDCMNIFTKGQANAMFNILNGIRSELLEEALQICNISSDCKDLLVSNLQSGFEDNTETEDWRTEDRNSDQISWEFRVENNNDWGPNTGSGLAIYLWNEDGITAADDYLFTPCFQIIKGHLYELQFAIASAKDDTGNTYPERLEVGFSANQSSLDFYSPDNWRYDPFDQPYPAYQEERLQFSVLDNTTISIGFHVYSEADQYALQLDDIRIFDLGLVNASSPTVEVDGIKIFPNPVVSSMTVSLNLPVDVELNRLGLYDITGKLIEQRNLPKSSPVSIQVDMSSLSEGIYFVLLETSSGIISRKVVLAGRD